MVFFFTMNYSEKLKDPRWQKKRLEVLQRDDFRCLLCGDPDSSLHVHHQKYVGDNPWNAPTMFLRTYCEHCHAVIELNKNNNIIFISKEKCGNGDYLLFVGRQDNDRVYIDLYKFRYDAISFLGTVSPDFLYGLVNFLKCNV